MGSTRHSLPHLPTSFFMWLDLICRRRILKGCAHVVGILYTTCSIIQTADHVQWGGQIVRCLFDCTWCSSIIVYVERAYHYFGPSCLPALILVGCCSLCQHGDCGGHWVQRSATGGMYAQKINWRVKWDTLVMKMEIHAEKDDTSEWGMGCLSIAEYTFMNVNSALFVGCGMGFARPFCY